MSWFRVSDKAAFHAKVIAAGNEAFGAWTRAGSWSSDHLTDGFIPFDAAHAIGGPKLWKKLIEAKAGHEHGLAEPAEGGYQIHDYLDCNPPATEVRAKRAAWAARQQKSRTSRGDTGGDNPTTSRGDSREESRPRHARPIPVPSPDPEDPQHTHTAGAREGGSAGAQTALPEAMGPEAREIFEALRGHPVLAGAADTAPLGRSTALRELAEQLAGQVMSSGRPIAWHITAIADAARDIGAESAGSGPPSWSHASKTVARYSSRARAPRDGPGQPRAGLRSSPSLQQPAPPGQHEYPLGKEI